jgi:phosphoglucosamine mutase
MGLIATRWAEAGKLAGDTLVTTVMSNLGLERHLAAKGIALERTAVGDRYVVERMLSGGFNLGGEQSGHLVMTDHTTTGDGLIAALQFLGFMVESGQKASQLAQVFQPIPQRLINLRYTAGTAPLDSDAVQDAIHKGEKALQGTGRILIRKSGTEPLIRVMGEAENPAQLEQVLNTIVQAVKAAC